MADKGLVVLALHYSTTEQEPEVLQVARKNKWPYPVYFGTDMNNYKLKNPPQVFIFNHAGKAVYTPKDFDWEEKLAGHVKEAPDWLVGDRSFKALERQARLVAKRRSLGRLLGDLEKTAKGGKGTEQEEASYLVERCKWYEQHLRDRMKELTARGQPKEAQDILKDLSTLFRGHPLGDKAKKEYAALRKSAEFKRELAASRAAKSVKKAYFALDFEARSKDEAAWKKQAARAIASLQKKFKAFAGKYEGTGTCKHLKRLMGYLE